jgi:RNA polymerase sigma-70 factor (sigma-E family)
VSEGRFSPREAEELAACFNVYARDLFGHACVLTRSDRVMAEDLVQAVFEAAAEDWQVPGDLTEEQRRGWLWRTLANIAVDGFRRETAFRDRLPRIEALYRKTQADPPEQAPPEQAPPEQAPPEQALSSIALERCWRIIQGLAQRQHAVALLRWQLGMKAGEIAQVLGMDERTVSVHLQRVRRAVGRETGSSPEDALLSRVYQQVAEWQEPRFSAEYDLDKGLERYRTWLHEPAGAAEHQHATGPEWNADRAVTELYSEHYRALVRLAAMLVRDTQTAEEVVQDAFVAMHDGWQRLRDNEKALAYLRQAVVNRSRSVLRHRTVIDKNMQKAPPDMPSAEHGALVLLERHAVVAALRHLPGRQREAIVLRYYADLSEADIAASMGISRGAVKSHTSRGMAALRAALEQE